MDNILDATRIFENNFRFGEMFTKEIIDKNPVDLIGFLLTCMLFYGIDRTEQAIRNSFSKRDAILITAMVNLALKTYSQNMQKESSNV